MEFGLMFDEFWRHSWTNNNGLGENEYGALSFCGCTEQHNVYGWMIETPLYIQLLPLKMINKLIRIKKTSKYLNMPFIIKLFPFQKYANNH